MPRRAFEFRNVNNLAVRRNCQPIASAFVCPVPDSFASDRINRDHRIERCHIDSARDSAGCNAFHVLGLLALGYAPGRDASDELVAMIGIKDEDADAAILGIVPDSGSRYVQEVARGRGSRPGKEHRAACR